MHAAEKYAYHVSCALSTDQWNYECDSTLHISLAWPKTESVFRLFNTAWCMAVILTTDIADAQKIGTWQWWCPVWEVLCELECLLPLQVRRQRSPSPDDTNRDGRTWGCLFPIVSIPREPSVIESHILINRHGHEQRRYLCHARYTSRQDKANNDFSSQRLYDYVLPQAYLTLICYSFSTAVRCYDIGRW